VALAVILRPQFQGLQIPAGAVHPLGDLSYPAPVIEPAVSEGRITGGTRHKYRGQRRAHPATTRA
jgi:hypothetical protein